MTQFCGELKMKSIMDGSKGVHQTTWSHLNQPKPPTKWNKCIALQVPMNHTAQYGTMCGFVCVYCLVYFCVTFFVTDAIYIYITYYHIVMVIYGKLVICVCNTCFVSQVFVLFKSYWVTDGVIWDYVILSCHC